MYLRQRWMFMWLLDAGPELLEREPGIFKLCDCKLALFSPSSLQSHVYFLSLHLHPLFTIEFITSFYISVLDYDIDILFCTLLHVTIAFVW